MKIWTKTDKWMGYIPSDKVNYRGIAFEAFDISNFIDRTDANLIVQEYGKKALIKKIKETHLYQKISTEKYHTHLYLNFNMNGVQSFISR